MTFSLQLFDFWTDRRLIVKVFNIKLSFIPSSPPLFLVSVQYLPWASRSDRPCCSRKISEPPGRNPQRWAWPSCPGELWSSRCRSGGERRCLDIPGSEYFPLSPRYLRHTLRNIKMTRECENDRKFSLPSMLAVTLTTNPVRSCWLPSLWKSSRTLLPKLSSVAGLVWPQKVPRTGEVTLSSWTWT